MPSLAALTTNEAEVAIDFYGESITCWYRPGDLTLEKYQRLTDKLSVQIEGDQQATRLLIEGFSEIAYRWDITDSEGNMIPIESDVYETAEVDGEPREVLVKPSPLRKVPVAILGRLSEAIMKDMAPNPSRTSPENSESQAQVRTLRGIGSFEPRRG